MASPAASIHSHGSVYDASDRTLRLITFFTALVAFALCIPYGVIAMHPNEAWSWVAIMPITASGLFSLGTVVLPGRIKLGQNAQKKAKVVLLSDTLITLALLGNFIGGVVRMSSSGSSWGWRYRMPAAMMVGTFALASMLLMLCIHIVFTLRATGTLIKQRYNDLRESWRMRPSISAEATRTCPHCQRHIHPETQDVPTASGGKETYHRVPGRDDGVNDDEESMVGEASMSAFATPRPSTEGERAPLV